MFIDGSSIEIPDDELVFSFARSGGPGGQNVNKVNSKAILHWKIEVSSSLPEDVKSRFLAKYANKLTTEGDLVLSSQKFRDQTKNIDDCKLKLSEMIGSVLKAPVKRKATKPSKMAKEKRIQNKKATSVRKAGRKQPRMGDD